MYSTQDMHKCMELSLTAFKVYQKTSFATRTALADEIILQLKHVRSLLIDTAVQETHLKRERLNAEFDRTLIQFKSYFNAFNTGNWFMPRIDLTNKDVRKTFVPLGPVVVYGASNFPFAYSTPGGDVASALAAGCTVVVKAHPAHPQTAHIAAQAIQQAISHLNLHPGIFQQIMLNDSAEGKHLVQHPATAAVAFTGSYTGGKQLFDWANERDQPIPVFAEMGSVNPVFIPHTLTPQDIEKYATSICHAVSQSSGQFCTKPGIIIGVQSLAWENFTALFKTHLLKQNPAPLLHSGIHQQFFKGVEHRTLLAGVECVLNNNNGLQDVYPVLHTVEAQTFLKQPALSEEIFGPCTLIVTCHSTEEMLAVAQSLQGQLTCTVITGSESNTFISELLDMLQHKAGRLIVNDVPTGVDVVTAMQHGGPFPATTDSRFTSVGPDSVSRFVRPVVYQHCPNHLLPDALKNENPLKIWRMINGQLTQSSV